MRKKTTLGRVTSLIGAMALAFTLASCGGPTIDDEQNETPQTNGGGQEGNGAGQEGNDPVELSDLDIALLPKAVNIPMFDASAAGAERVAEEIGASFDYNGPSTVSAAEQVSYLETLSQQQKDIIIISASDPDALCPSLDQTRAAGTSIVTFDSDTNESCRDAFINPASNESVGQTLLELAAEQIGGEGEVAILSGSANATNQNAWIATFEEELETNPEYANITLVATVYGDDEDQKSFEQTQGLLQAHPDLAAIVVPSSPGVAAAARYVSTSQYKGEVAITGLGLPNEMATFIEDGTVTAFALWDPEAMGALAAYTGIALATGEITGAEGETFTAGDMGEYTIGVGGEIVLGPPLVFDADNVRDYDF